MLQKMPQLLLIITTKKKTSDKPERRQRQWKWPLSLFSIYCHSEVLPPAFFTCFSANIRVPTEILQQNSNTGWFSYKLNKVDVNTEHTPCSWLFLSQGSLMVYAVAQEGCLDALTHHKLGSSAPSSQQKVWELVLVKYSTKAGLNECSVRVCSAISYRNNKESSQTSAKAFHWPPWLLWGLMSQQQNCQVQSSSRRTWTGHSFPDISFQGLFPILAHRTSTKPSTLHLSHGNLLS